MKVIVGVLSLIFLFSFCDAQDRGKITSIQIPSKARIEKIYVYQPPKNLLLPDRIEALILYQNKQQFYSKYILVNKVDNKYKFLFTPPDSVSVLIIGMVDAKINNADYNILSATRKKVVDNNSGAGFIFYLGNKSDKQFAAAKVVLAALLHSYASYYLNTNNEKGLIIKLYEEAYKLYPELKKGDSYLDYLTILYDENENAAKPQLMAFVNQMEKVQNNETKWLKAASAYSLLKMDVEQQKLEHKILKTYPNGEFAKQKFWSFFYAFYKKEGDSEQSILDSMNRYISRFGDNSNKVKDVFYAKISSLFFDKREWANVLKYQELASDRFSMMYFYDHFAWELSGGKIDNMATDLEIAKSFSKKSIDYIHRCIKNSVTPDDPDLNLKGALNKYINTYALILYKLGQHDSAFYYQDSLYQQGNELNYTRFRKVCCLCPKNKGDSLCQASAGTTIIKWYRLSHIGNSVAIDL